MGTADPMTQSSSAEISALLAEFTRRISLELATERLELPSFPEVALRVRRALARDDASIDEVARIVSAEPSLSVRLLQLANSVAINPGARRALTLRAAIARVGFNLARSATIAFAMSQMRRAAAWRGLGDRFRLIWERSARVAATSHAIARHCARDDADQALLAGMLSALGRLFVLTRVNAFPALLADPGTYAAIEASWQSRAARVLLVRWDLSGEVFEAACNFGQAAEQGSQGASLGDVLHAGSYLSSLRGAVPAGEILDSEPLRRLGLDAAAASAVLTESAADILSLKAALSD